VGYFPEHAPYYPELSVRGYLRLVARLKRLPRATRGEAVARVLAACGLEAVAHRRVGTLSKGYRQRVGVAQALCGDPPILILDEPTIGLDPAQVVEIRSLVQGLRGSRTVLFSSHILTEVEAVCERVIVIARGRIVGEGTPAELGARLGRSRLEDIFLDLVRDEPAGREQA
jgi:ABC-2 type transport system ATP-binding protein